MVRIKRGNVARKFRKKILDFAKGFSGKHSKLFRVANQKVFHALLYSYRGRKERKRFFRRLWITRIGIATRFYDISYSRFINHLKNDKILLNRKMLSHIAIFDPLSWESLLQSVSDKTHS
uniref:50S ribosomal protein L20 n=1 Tax=Eustigmatophyceae sp. Ndem 8/9T-3m6.8 TaxID=2506146 RepID=A0A3R5U4Z9_9STRA|nr:ribosomal protein L20 [Eustigmatophyceae sp. Ndem 8/9T-3m6.8]QAA11885.1 ribosomal protein L20 [Eustigmatophyceae sp. Ndem 8/9T-3m6.8]